MPSLPSGPSGPAGLSPHFTSDPQRLSGLLEFLSEAPTPQELLRFLVHVPVLAPGPRAGAMGMISGEAELVELASYGLTKHHGFVERRSVWHQVPPFVDFHDVLPVRRSANDMRQAVAKAGITIEPEGWVNSVLIQPVHGFRGAPIGALVMLFEQAVTEPLEPLVSPKDFHSALVLAFKSEPFRQALEESDPRLNGDTPLMTDREITCLRLAARGYTNKEIAGQLKLSLSTIKTTMARCYDKLDVTKRTKAVEAAQALGLL
ncbi:LuxR C-terminal-related transcriptional regulator [Pontimonas sp.]|uniref:helix-turn-helix transcriptional regulator n=1 Tax=Pontimonas sp. TaxID=2304492 RepID=UPI0028706062|nr:LuxR C-terminal-related transcriptional regulator [Pontimonas sp.]MDR9396819.1 LuxR C-terminal-related transcriptional regulator [Pontimonas sp.]